MPRVISDYRTALGMVPRRTCLPRRSDWRIVQQIDATANSFRALSDSQLRQRADDLRETAPKENEKKTGWFQPRNRIPADLLIQTFALCRESARRTLAVEHYPVQLLAGVVLGTGAIAEMQTGEGKTLTGTLAMALAAISGRRVHVATVNSYLCERDCEHLRPMLELLGITVGCSKDGASNDEKRGAYAAEVTFATGYELGFDHLRDEVSRRAMQQTVPGQKFRMALRGVRRLDNGVQQTRDIALIDEIDSVMIDEGTTPLVISGASGTATSDSHLAALGAAQTLAESLVDGTDYELELYARRIRLTAAGNRAIHRQMPGCTLLRPWSLYVEQALRARHLYRRNEHYVVRDDAVRIVDEYTGRIFDDRTWRDGLHQAIEFRERVKVTDDKRSLARISRQCFFRLYKRLSGMSGTASGHETEWAGFYQLPVVKIPTRKPLLRRELPTLYFSSEADKWDAIAREIAARHRAGQPVLVGTRTIANSLALAGLLEENRLPFQILNGIQDRDEADLVSSAGQSSSITIATNMAGRGTDIRPDAAARRAGGLHVIAAERHESNRIDRQLAGRAARQGEPGSCQFFVSADDPIVRWRDKSLAEWLQKNATRDGVPIAAIDARISQLQLIAEEKSYLQRQSLLDRELWLNEFAKQVA